MLVDVDAAFLPGFLPGSMRFAGNHTTLVALALAQNEVRRGAQNSLGMCRYPSTLDSIIDDCLRTDFAVPSLSLRTR